MEKFLFVLSRGLEDPSRATRVFLLAKVAKAKGHEVNMFLEVMLFWDWSIMLCPNCKCGQTIY